MGSEEKPEGTAEETLIELTAAPAGEGDTLLELLLAEQEARAAEGPAEQAPIPQASMLPARIDGVVVGELVAFEPSGTPLVTFPGAPEGGLAARAVAPIGPEDAGREVALMFEGGDPARPLIMGRMFMPSTGRKAEVKADGDRLELTAEKEIVLRCGDASITLTRAGKILIRGAYVLTRSSGVNRIQGGSVEIN
jgi:hypothetical protein